MAVPGKLSNFISSITTSNSYDFFFLLIVELNSIITDEDKAVL